MTKFCFIMNFSMKSVVLLATWCLLFSFNSSAMSIDADSSPTHSRDCSNRCSLVNTVSLGTFNADLQGWTALKGCKLSFSDGKVMGDKAQEGAKSLLIEADDMAANVWKGIAKDFSKPLNLSSKSLLEFNVLAPSVRPGRRDFVRLILSDGTQSFEARSEIVPSMWRSVIFDISGCTFLKKIKHIEIALMNDTLETWKDCRFMFDNICVGKPLDLLFSIKGSSDCFTAVHGKISEGNDAMRFDFKKDAYITTTALTGSRNSIYNPPIDIYNTFFLVIANKSNVKQVRLYFTTSDFPDFNMAASKVFNVIPNSDYTAYYVNLSDTKCCRGHLTGFRLEPIGDSKGTWLIDRVSILQEKPIETYAGRIRCTATTDFLDIKGDMSSDYVNRYPTLVIYEAPMFSIDGKVNSVKQLEGLTKLYEGPSSAHFDITSITNHRLDGKMSRLSSRMLAVVKNEAGEVVKVAPYFFIENWRDFEDNPYAFSLPDKKFNVLDYGAKGNGFTDDTQAINAAISACSTSGGGQVILPGNVLPGTDSIYGRRYVATNIMLKSNVDLHLEEGAIIWQSADRRDYKYDVNYGHNMDIPNIPWTHCLFVNLPLVELKDLHHVKVTGPGKLLMYSLYTLDPDIFWLHSHCSDVIHLCPIGVDNCDQVEMTDIDIELSPNYFTQFCYTTNLFIGNVKMAYPTCTSGDGLGFSNGMNHVKVVRAVYNSNDDGVTITSSYGDPRNTISPWRPARPGADNSTRNIVVSHSYINTDIGGNLGDGGAHAIALLPWGTTNDQQKQEIDSITVYDCVLRGPYAVGVWPDNPFDGKPFTNSERDDFAPIKNVYIHNNEYLKVCDLLWVTPTNFTGDTGIHSANKFVNGDFSLGHCYWSVIGNAGAAKGEGYVREGGRLFEGLYLNKGKITFTADVKGEGCLEVISVKDSRTIATLDFNSVDWKQQMLNVTIPDTGDYYVGLSGTDVCVRKCDIQ